MSEQTVWHEAIITITTKCGKTIKFTKHGSVDILLSHMLEMMRTQSHLFMEGNDRVPFVVPVDNVAFLTGEDCTRTTDANRKKQ